ncbi:tetratricopeptide repeat protein [Nocardia tengchongensis]|uniref:tetratricopeptide repeat protein n=1 Tax=Nocardia tengchongensis TaxID=2055889 RepID=UPI0036A0610D
MTRSDATAPEIARLARSLRALGLSESTLIEPLALELVRRGLRPRTAWRKANGLNQRQAADRFNQLAPLVDPDGHREPRMKNSRLCEIEKWPARTPEGYCYRAPALHTLELLALVYNTTWDRLIDLEDLAQLSPGDRRAYQSARERLGLNRTAAGLHYVPSGDTVTFVGRRRAMEEMRRRVDLHFLGDSRAQLITGVAGVGKTAFARQLVAKFADRFPDGAVWLSMRSHDREARADGQDRDAGARLLAAGLNQLGVQAPLHAEPGRLLQLWQRETGGRRLVVVFDDVLESKQIRPLLPRSAGCFVVITSRRPLTGMVRVNQLELEPLGLDEAEEMLATLGNLGPGYDSGAARRIVAVAGGLPLPIRLVAGRISRTPGLLADLRDDLDTLTTLVTLPATDPSAGLCPAELILDKFAAEDESTRDAFTLSYARLRDEEARRAVRLLGWFPSATVSSDDFAALAQAEDSAAKRLLQRVFEDGMIDQLASRPGHQRYRMHNLLHLYARCRADAESLPGEHGAALGRLLRHYLETAHAIGKPRPFDTVHQHAGRDSRNPNMAVMQARPWFEERLGTMIACARTAERTSDTARFADLLAGQLATLGYVAESRAMFELATTINHAIGDRTAECDAWYGLGHLLRTVREYARAAACYEHARLLAEEIGDHARTARTLLWHAAALRHQDRRDAARAAVRQVLRIAHSIGDPHLECDALRELGHIERLSEQYAAGDEYYRRAHAIALRIGDRYCEGWSVWGLGGIAGLRGDLDESWTLFEEAYRISKEIPDTLLQIDTLRGFGHIHRNRGEFDAARIKYEESRALTRGMSDAGGEAAAWWALGELERRADNPALAQVYLEKARTLCEGIDPARLLKVQQTLTALGA